MSDTAADVENEEPQEAPPAAAADQDDGPGDAAAKTQGGEGHSGGKQAGLVRTMKQLLMGLP